MKGIRTIDLENHFYLPEFIEYLKTRTEVPFYDKKTNKIAVRKSPLTGTIVMNPQNVIIMNNRTAVDNLCDLGDTRIANMDEHGIDTAVISSSQMLEELPKEEAVYFTRKTNDAIAEAAKKYPGRYLGAANLPTPYVDEAIKELERCVKELGFPIWHTHSNFLNEHLYDEKFKPLFAKAEELNCPFYVHPQSPANEDMLEMGFQYDGAGLGYGQDTMKTTLRLILTGLFDEFPKLKMIIGHLGEYYPFVLDRTDNRFTTTPEPEYIKAKHALSYYFKNKNIYVTTSGNMSKSAFNCTKEVLGLDSIMYGTDYPYEVLSDMQDFMLSLDLTPDELKKVLSGNAEKLLNI